MKKSITLAAVALAMATCTFAQSTGKDYDPAPYGFAGIQGGMLRTYSGDGIDRKWKPMGGLQVGYFFNEVLGVRLQGTYSKWTADLADNSSYDCSRLGIDMDVLFNFSSLLFPHRHNFIDVIGVAGMPFELALPHTKVKNVATCENSQYTNWKSGWKGGGIVRLNLAKHWAIDLEAGTSFIGKRTADNYFQSKWWPYAMAGVTYKFGHRKSSKPAMTALVSEPVAQPTNAVAEAAPETAAVAETPEAVVVTAKAKTTQNVFFEKGKDAIRPMQALKLDEVVAWANNHPSASIVLTGYADKLTGSAQLNQSLSERRAAAVKNALVDKGIAANRIETDAKGDTVQPFASNDDNRAVVIVAAE